MGYEYFKAISNQISQINHIFSLDPRGWYRDTCMVLSRGDTSPWLPNIMINPPLPVYLQYLRLIDWSDFKKKKKDWGRQMTIYIDLNADKDWDPV